MIRDYTAKTEERLLKQIDEVNSETWCWLTDGIGDCLSTVGKWLGLLDLKDDMSNVESYQKEILDQTNMTKKELKKIFEDVYSVDTEFRGKFDEINNKESTYNEKLQTLIGMINPNFQIASSEEIMAAMTSYNDKLKNIDKQIAETYTAEMDWAAKEALKDAGKHFFKGLAKIAGGIGNIMTGNPAGIVDTVNGLFELGSSLQTAMNLGGYAIYGGIADLKGESLSDKLSSKNRFLEDAEKTADNDGLADVFRDQGWDGAAKVMDIVDTAADIVNIATGIDGFCKDPKLIDTNFGFKDISNQDNVSETFKLLKVRVSDDILFKVEGIDSWKTYEQLMTISKWKNVGKQWKNAGKAINYATSYYNLVSGQDTEEFFKLFVKNGIPLYGQVQSAVDKVNDRVDLYVDEFEEMMNL